MAKKIILTGEKFSPLFNEEGQVDLGQDGRYELLNLNEIEPREDQPRKYFSEEGINELSLSIKENGVLQPILVTKAGKTGYNIIAGERRYRAAMMAGLSQIPAIVRDIDERSIAIFALIENIQRADLTAIEEAKAYQALIAEHKLTHEQVAKSVGKSRSSITNALRLLELNTEVMIELDKGNLEMGHARALAGLSEEEQSRAVKEVVKRKLNVREAEEYVKDFKVAGQGVNLALNRKMIALENRFQYYASKTKLKSVGQGKIRLTLDFNSIDEIERMVDQLGE